MPNYPKKLTKYAGIEEIYPALIRPMRRVDKVGRITDALLGQDSKEDSHDSEPGKPSEAVFAPSEGQGASSVENEPQDYPVSLSDDHGSDPVFTPDESDPMAACNNPFMGGDYSTPDDIRFIPAAFREQLAPKKKPSTAAGCFAEGLKRVLRGPMSYNGSDFVLNED